MQVCGHCGKESRDGDTYCMHCGQRLEAPAPVLAQAAADASASGDRQWPRQAGPVSASADVAARGHLKESASREEPLPASAGRLILEAADGSQPAREIALDGRNVTIGRAPACTVSLPDDQLASRLHAMLHFTGEQYTISDLGSSNGTLVNGTLIRGATPLAEGDRITVGQHMLVYTHTLAAQAAAQAPAPMEETQAPAPEPGPAAMPVADVAPETATTAEAQPEADDGADAAQFAWTPPDAASEQPTAPAPVPAMPAMPAWPPATPDPWVLPAPAQWAAGPQPAAQETWSAAPAGEVAETAGDDAARPESGWPPAAGDLAGASVAASAGDDWPVLAHSWDAAPAAMNDMDTTSGAGDGIDASDTSELAAVAASVTPGAPLSVDTAARPAVEQAPSTGELGQLRTQLVQSSELLSRWTQSATAQTRHIRAELAALTEDVAGALADAQQGASAGTLDDLLRLAEEAAQDPHHVNTVVALAGRSSEVASALKAQRQLVATLSRVHERLSELARQEHW